MNGNALLLIQCKSNTWPIPAERAVMEKFEAPWGAIKMMWRYDDRNTHPRIKVWANPTNIWEWVEISDLPVPIITPEGVTLQFAYTGASLRKAMKELEGKSLLEITPDDWIPAEL
jgi:hypothetical protein